jgi:hypothetical protein
MDHNKINETITLTFSECVENHVGMEKIGTKTTKGYSLEELYEIKDRAEKDEIKCEMYDLTGTCVDKKIDDSACVLVLRNVFDTKILFEKLKSLKWDTKAKMRGKVVNKRARYNLCFCDKEQEPDYNQGKGRIVSFSSIDELQNLRNLILKYTNDKLLAEGNYYYNINKCGIGYHGDSERCKVVGYRIGASMDLYYQWYFKSERIGEQTRIPLHDGDMYIMGHKATGNDWKRRIVYTLRHATGCHTYTK